MATLGNIIGIDEVLIEETLEYIIHEQYGVTLSNGSLNLHDALLYKFMFESVTEFNCDINQKADAELSRNLEQMLYKRD